MRLAIIGYTLAIITTALPAAAQDVRVLQDRVQRLEAELVQLQRQIYRGGVATPAPTTSVGDQGSVVGNLLVRLDEIEGQIRNLTGRVERMEYQNQQTQARLDKLVEDVDFRLSALEKGAPQSGTQQRGSTTPPPSAPAQASGQSGTLPPGWVTGPGPAPTPQQQAAAPTTPKGKLPPGTPQERYNYAVKLLQQGDYGEAESALNEFIAAHPRDPLAANAQFWVGETFFVRTQYDRAAQAFLAVYQKYPKSQKAPESLLKLATSLSNLNQKQEACAVLQQLATEYPSAEASVKQGAARERQRAGCR
jgi:tol-pal system protein YbgF